MKYKALVVDSPAEWFIQCFTWCVRTVMCLLLDICDTLQTVGQRYESADMPVHVDQLSAVKQTVEYDEQMKHDVPKI